MHDQLVQIFCKLPEPGKVKTRLAECLGDRGAAELAGELAERLICRVAPAFSSELWFTLEDTMGFLARFPYLAQKAQAEGDLGKRMRCALADGMSRADKVILVGSDCPLIDAAYVADAFDRLEDHDIVLGPVEDGGYALIGVRHVLPPVFENMTWSTDSVLSETCRRLNVAGINYALLPLTWDVDRPADLKRYDELLEQESP